MKNYYFVNSGSQNGDRGDGRMTLDLAAMIAKHLHIEPIFLDGSAALQKLAEDPNAFVFDLSSRNKYPLTQGAYADRVFRIHIHNHLGGVSAINSLFDVYLSPAFNPIDPRLTQGKVPIIGFNCLPSRVTPENTAQAAADWRAAHADISVKPIVGLVIGSLGDNYGQSYWIDKSKTLLQQLTELGAREDLSVCYTTTWRTEPSLCAFLKNTFPAAPIGYDWRADTDNRKSTGGKSNPYLAMLGLSDKIIVEGDSISNQGDVAATGKPIYILGGHNVTSSEGLKNFAADEPWFTVKNMIDILVKGGAAQPYYTGALEKEWQPRSLDNWPQVMATIIDYAERKQQPNPRFSIMKIARGIGRRPRS
ncbi:MAG: ELM1/GtrOC1 family putative glycosyltransferase [Alphaproteobacteria bacterium]